jgi:hypothetical protein
MTRRIRNAGEHHAVCRWCRKHLKVNANRSEIKRQIRRRERQEGKREIEAGS